MTNPDDRTGHRLSVCRCIANPGVSGASNVPNSLVPTRHDPRTASPDTRWTEAIRNVRFIEDWMATATGWSWSVRAAHRAESSDRSTTDDSYRQYGSESYLSAPWSRETSGSLFAWSVDYAKLEVAIYVGACRTTVDTVAIRSTLATAKANTA